ncbi:MAG: hypothetical protein HY055_06930 [Magnetospirillum sp.]|nr:hypothetical protein [Magnetospirillum sp.]
MDRPNDNCCRWINGDVKSGKATWCGAPTRHGSSWCLEHRRVVYVRWRPVSGAPKQAPTPPPES